MAGTEGTKSGDTIAADELQLQRNLENTMTHENFNRLVIDTPTSHGAAMKARSELDDLVGWVANEFNEGSYQALPEEELVDGLHYDNARGDLLRDADLFEEAFAAWKAA